MSVHRRYIGIWICAVLFVAIGQPRAAEELTCLPAQTGAQQVYGYLQLEAYLALGQRRERYEQLKTAEEIAAYQAKLREFFLRQLGGFPERGPLNAQVVGTLPGDGFRIEKVIFESQPNHHVTANLYLPAGQPPFPAVAVSSGHSRTAKTAAYNQRFAVALARHGMAALCYDPIGQGERSQILKPDGQPQFASTTQEHTLMGVGSILLGRNTARYRVWDGMRAIDYLTSRSDIDPQRIGFTGCSGGGTLTSYVMALDSRVACAAPACYLTTFRRLVETIGPQDAEQNIFGQVGFGLDQPDYVILTAPRPVLISSTTGDFFDIQGSWDNFRQAKRIYTRLGFPERVDLVEAEGGHGVQPENLMAITRWMRRWLLGKDEPVELGDLPLREERELLCTEKGQVLLLPGERSVFDLNAALEEKLAVMRGEYWAKTERPAALAAVRQTIGARALSDVAEVKMKEIGRVQRDGYHIDKIVLEYPYPGGGGLPLPALTYHPPKPQRDAYLYVHGGGKTADGGPGGPIEKLVRDGYVVVAVDLRGMGETGAPRRDSLLGDSKPFFLAYLLGQSLVGLRTEDIWASGRWVAYYETSKPRPVHLVAAGDAVIPALHAAALEPEMFASVTLRGELGSWSQIVREPVPGGQLSHAVHGALKLYDLPHLLKTIDPSRLTVQP